MSSQLPLADRWSARIGSEPTAALEDSLRALVAEATTRWPEDWLSAERFIDSVGDRLVGDDSAAAVEIDQLASADLYLAGAALEGHPAALESFERELVSAVDATARRLGAAPDDIDEVAQRVRERLLVATADRRPRLADYRGTGALHGWLRAVAGRTYLNMKRGQKREVLLGDSGLLDALGEPGRDPELAHMRQLYRTQFAESFTAALAELGDRDKTLLRYRYVDRVSMDKIAAIYRVHRATAHRWLAEARRSLAAATETELRRRLSIDPSEFNSIRRLVLSQLDLSLTGALGPGPRADDD